MRQIPRIAQFLILPTLLSAAPAFAGQAGAYTVLRADITKTVEELESKINTLHSNGAACSKFYNSNPCPAVPGVTTPVQGFINPMKNDIADVKKFLNEKLTSVETELAKGIDSEKLGSVTACAQGPQLAVEAEKTKKAALDSGYQALQKLVDNKSKKTNDEGLKQKLAELHTKTPAFAKTSAACGAAVSSFSFLGSTPKSPHEGLIKIFESANAPGNCSPSVLQTYMSVADQSNGTLVRLAKQLDALGVQMKKDSATVATMIAKTESVAKTCIDRPAENSKLAEKKKPDSDVSKPALAKKDESKFTTGTPVAASAAVAGAKPKVESAPTTEAAPKLAAPDGQNTAQDTVQKTLSEDPWAKAPSSAEGITGMTTGEDTTRWSQQSLKNTPAPDAGAQSEAWNDAPSSAVGINGAVEGQAASAAASHKQDSNDWGVANPIANGPNSKASESDPYPVQPLDDAPQRGLASASENSVPVPQEAIDGPKPFTQGMKQSYQENSVFTSRDLDFNSNKDTRIIQRALNQVQGGDSQLTTDGVFGTRTTAALDSVMQDPVKKAAFLKALHQQMK